MVEWLLLLAAVVGRSLSPRSTSSTSTTTVPCCLLARTNIALTAQEQFVPTTTLKVSGLVAVASTCLVHVLVESNIIMVDNLRIVLQDAYDDAISS